MNQSNRESIFDEEMKKILPQMDNYTDYDLVIGIPFNNDSQDLPKVLQSVDEVLQKWIGRRQLIVCVGDASASATLELIQKLSLHHPHLAFLLPPEGSGRGMSIRVLIETAKKMEADLIIFNANMRTSEGPGIDANWLESLLTPIQGSYDMVLGSLRQHCGIDSIAYMLAAPILESFYGSRLSDPLGGIYAIAHDLVEELASEAKFWTDFIAGAGIDFWLITRTLCWNKDICEVSMGGMVKSHQLAYRNQVFYEMSHTIFESLRRDSAVWLRDRLIIKVADILARSKVEQAEMAEYSLEDLRQEFKGYFDQSIQVMEQFLPVNALQELVKMMETQNGNFKDEFWVNSIYSFLLQYAFGEEKQQPEILTALMALYNGKITSHALEMQEFYEQIKELSHSNEMMIQKMESIHQRITEEFWRQKPALSRQWAARSEQAKPPLVPLGYMEYIPNRPIVVPKKISGKDQRIVQTDDLFKHLRRRYEDRFTRFITDGLGLNPKAEAEEIIRAVEAFIQQAEQTIDGLLPGNLQEEAGLDTFVNRLFAVVPHQQIFSINHDLLREMLIRFPPVNLMIPLGYYRPADLIANMDPRDAVTYANLVESWSYNDRDLIWMTDQLKPESFEWVELKPLIINSDLPIGAWSHNKVSNLNRITARVTIKALEQQKGGKYPKLRYFTSIIRRICLAEQYSRLFRQNVKERKNIGDKARNALMRMEKGDDFSAQKMFENNVQRELVGKIRSMAEILAGEGKRDEARIFHLMADGYGLSQVLEDGTFLSCTVWSWASYSFKGGLKIPTPISTSIESRWFNHEFLEALYEELGYDKQEIMQTVYRSIQAGRNGQSLLDALLPHRPKDVTVVVQETTNEPSKNLKRYQGNPLLEPIAEHHWECKYVLNPGALRIKDKVYLFYRAVGNDDVSHIGLAVTDGYEVLERLDRPIFSPAMPEEKMGCEDPRLIVIEKRIWMLYTAYDGNIAQIAAASIGVEDFLARRFEKWQREGLAFKNIWDKDAILFPDRINGKYILYHRIEPSMWITYMQELSFPCREKHAIIIGPRPGRMWDSLKIGAGAQPIKTRYGWLLIYHGVDYNYVYRLGVILVDLKNPQKVIYRSPNPVLEPIEDYELGLSGAWVPNVVFTCGAVASTDKEILEDDDEILVYYGAADTSIGMAKATLAELIPEKFRSV
ncbi:MAG: glycosidase [Syntrophomonadaceae bacterium]|nr:glycosidase [Syntrophomonadaceae bacterium]